MPGLAFSASTALQYLVLGVLGYILAGAPSLPLRSGRDATFQRWSRRASPGVASVSHEKLETLVIPDRNLSCEGHGFKGVYILNREPLVAYIEGFLSDEEVQHVIRISEPHFTPSTVWTAGVERLDPAVRLSEKAKIPRDATVQCIEERARIFQGWRPYVFVERLWAQRYGPGGHYSYHYDWGHTSRRSGRISSFMVWLGDECEGGSTRFPRLEKPVSKDWCRFIECEQQEEQSRNEGESEEMGVSFKPIRGNAVYWENMRWDGVGFEESWHAGLPVTKGTKIGLNIWSWYQEGYDPYSTP